MSKNKLKPSGTTKENRSLVSGFKTLTGFFCSPLVTRIPTVIVLSFSFSKQ